MPHITRSRMPTKPRRSSAITPATAVASTLVLSIMIGSGSVAAAPGTIDGDALVVALREHAVTIDGPGDLDQLIDALADRRCVLLGEASHGTEEYYTWRSAISRRLIAEHDFRFIAVEGDWGSCRAVDRYVRHADDAPESAVAALRAFTRWPTWLWNNQVTLELVEWLREHNATLPPERRVGFYGIDLYGLSDSIAKTPRHLARIDAEVAESARQALACIEPFAAEPRRYVVERLQRGESCADPLRSVVTLLTERRDDFVAVDAEAFFHAKQNALVSKNAEAHWRAMLEPGSASWNIRARHFDRTVERLLDRYGPDARGIVWAHNTHIGDARATPMATRGMVNIGQLIRERLGDDAVALVGFETHRGSVVAGARWDTPARTMVVPPAIPGSLGDLLRRVREEPFYLLFDDALRAHPGLAATIGHRAIGVTYDPSQERGNYVPTIVPRRYDAVVFVPVTTALRPVGSPTPSDPEPRVE